MLYFAVWGALFVVFAVALLIFWHSGEELTLTDSTCTPEDLQRISGECREGPVSRRWP